MTVYYVKESGSNGTGLNDANAWSPSYFESIQEGGLANSDTILFKSNNNLPLKIITARTGLVYGTYGTGDKPNITGYQTLESWTLHSGNIYWSSLDVPFLNNVKLDGIPKGMGRYPNTGYLQIQSHTGNTSISSTDVVDIPFDPTGAEVVIRKDRWILDRHFITSRTGDTLNYQLTSPHGQNEIYEPKDLNGFFIQNTLEALSLEGDWYYDKAENRLYMHFGIGSPSGREVMASVRDKNIQINTFNNITVNDLSFEGANEFGAWNINSSSLAYNDCDFINQGADGIWGTSLTGFEINGGLIKTAMNNGVFLISENQTVSIDGLTVEDSHLIAGAGKSGDGNGNAIVVVGDDIDIINNTINKSGYNGIDFRGNNILVENNDIDTVCTVKDDGACIYTYTIPGVTESNRIIRKNRVKNAIGIYEGAEWGYWEPFGKAAGIYLDGDSNNVTVDDNKVQNGNWAGIFCHNIRTGVTIKVNKVKGFPWQVAFTTYVANRLRGLIFSENTLDSIEDEICLYIHTYIDENPSDFGTFSNNVYNNPNSNQTLILKREGFAEVKMTLKTWKNEYGVEAGSLSNPKLYTKAGSLILNTGKVLVKSD